MAEEDEFRALPLFQNCWDLLILDLVLVEIGDSVDDDPGDTASEVNALVHDEAQDSGCEDIVLHVLVPTLGWVLAYLRWRSGCDTYSPKSLEHIQMNIVFRELIVDTKVGFWSAQGRIREDVHGWAEGGGSRGGQE